MGYWFSFTSLSAMILLADLGFSHIILQFAAHEFAFLHFNDKHEITGDEKHLKRLATFFVFCIKWASFIVLLAFMIIMLTGFFLFSQKTALNWTLPWIIYVFGAALTFFITSFLYFFEGCNSIASGQKIRMLITIITAIVMCIAIVSGFNLFSLSFSVLAGAIVGIFLLINRFKKTIRALWTISRNHIYSWKNEFFPLLGRYAISWASGYFIFQMYTPLMFHYKGAVDAGKVGISITLWLGVFSISNVWISAITPKINMFISRKDWKNLDRLFFKNLILSNITFLTGIITVFLLIFFLKNKISFFDRFVNNISMAFLAAGWLLQVNVNGLAVYLRAHKEEPLVIPSAVSAIYIVTVTLFSAKYLPPEYFFLGFISSYLWGIPWILTIFNQKRKRCHI